VFETAEINVIYAKLCRFEARLLEARPLHEPRGRNIWDSSPSGPMKSAPMSVDAPHCGKIACVAIVTWRCVPLCRSSYEHRHDLRWPSMTLRSFRLL